MSVEDTYPSVIAPDALRAWCVQWLGSQFEDVLFQRRHLSAVVGLRLADGRDVVIKARPPAARLAGCHAVHAHVSGAGFPCPRPLVGPRPLMGLTATAEAFIDGGEQLVPGPDSPGLFAEALAELLRVVPAVSAVPSLEPAPAWVWWDHSGRGAWPKPDDTDAELNAMPETAWLDDMARRVQLRLRRHQGTAIVGHVDWESQNMRWRDRQLHAVFDWDSVAACPEAVIVGCAAAVFTATGAPGAATVADSDAFLDAYGVARGRALGKDEREACWAAGLWVRCFNAKKECRDEGAEAMLEAFGKEATERLRLAAGA
jgi:hypothetical protein